MEFNKLTVLGNSVFVRINSIKMLLMTQKRYNYNSFSCKRCIKTITMSIYYWNFIFIDWSATNSISCVKESSQKIQWKLLSCFYYILWLILWRKLFAIKGISYSCVETFLAILILKILTVALVPLILQWTCTLVKIVFFWIWKENVC